MHGARLLCLLLNGHGDLLRSVGPVPDLEHKHSLYTHLAYNWNVQRPPMTVVETVRFLKDAEALIEESDRARLVPFIGANPEEGDLIPETGGVRKLRWALPGRGKR